MRGVVGMTADVVAYQPQEHILQDSAPIALMYRNMGTRTAEEVVTRALGELALTLSALTAALHRPEAPEVGRQLRRAQRMAEQLGMVSLGQVAGDLRDCLEARDPVALAAVRSRLMRVAEASLAPDKALLDRRT
jgi:hypothetical protein